MKTFEVRVDGRPVPTRAVRRALAGSRDITRELLAIGLPDAVVFETFGGDDPDALPFTPAQAKALRALLGRDAPLNGWQVEETRLWEQTFPAHREVVVEHTYRPFVGLAYDEPFQRRFPASGTGELTAASPVGEARLPAEACVDDSTRAGIDRRIDALAKAGAETVKRSLSDVEYILGTGRNWEGPIGDFTLRIEKETPDEIVSLCFPGRPVRTSPTTIEFHARDLVPQDRLVIYFYALGGAQAAPPSA